MKVEQAAFTRSLLSYNTTCAHLPYLGLEGENVACLFGRGFRIEDDVVCVCVCIWRDTIEAYIIIMAKTPKTVLDKVIAAIRAQKSAKGSSRQAIGKYLISEFDTDNATALKKALKKGVSDGKLIQEGQSFKVAGDKEYEAPKEEQVELTDVKVGEGPAAEKGDTVVVSYKGQLEDGSVFDKAKTFDFVLGCGDVIKGWDIGISGMKVGGKRQLVVPPKLGYGKKGAGPEIPPNATLYFTVKLKDIQ